MWTSIAPVSSVWGAADAFVLLTWYDPCSLVVLEAARWGIPSILTSYNGASALLGEAAVIVSSPRDIDAVTAGLEKLADQQQRTQMSSTCMKMVDKLSMERYIDELLDAYSNVSVNKKNN